jgi:B12-binding domain/radical SAM domain protein
VTRAALVLVDRPTGRPALVALAAAVESSSLAPAVDLVLARGAEGVARAIQARLSEGQRVVAAWSFFSAEVDAVRAELALVLAAAPGALHVAGGPHATALPEATLALGFDLVARGEGEATIVGLVGALLAGGDPRRIAGLAWREGGAVAGSGRAAPCDLDVVPAFSRRLGKALALEVTRGCVWACRFCQTPFLHRARFRHRSLESVRAFARYAVELGHRDLRFLTPSALSYGAERGEVRLAAVEALLATVREEIGPGRRLFFGTFPSELRPEHVSLEALALLRRYADNRELLVGAQSGSERQLAEMGRGHGVEEVLRAVRLAAQAGYAPSVDFILGLPGETEEDVAATRELMVRLAGLGARVHGHAFMPLPGTPWSGQAPGRVDGATAALLDRLASQGRAYGSWRRQAALARALARS